jgi:hypothetical protein
MTTSVLSSVSEPIQTALPVCLWKENPHRLVSLWNIMKPFYPALFTTMCGTGEIPNVDITISSAALAADTKELGLTMSRFQREHCVELGLTASVATLDKLQRLFSAPPDSTYGQIQELGKELRGRLHDELFGTLFLSLTYSESEYYSKPFGGWTETIKRFPTTITDVEEMSKCFALARYPGAVFHSVQAIECGLIEFGKFLGVTDPKSGWTAVTNKLAIVVTKTKYPDLDPIYQKHFAFIEQMHGTVGALNNAWRNKISHAQGRLVLMTSEFSPEVTEEIMIASRSFMRRLATELPI